MVEWIEPELTRVFCPAFADVFVRCEAPQGFQPLGEVVGRQESGEVLAKLVVAVVVVAADGRFFERSIHAFDLAVGPRVIDLGQPVFDGRFAAGALKDMLEDVVVALSIDELNTVISEDGVNFIGDGIDQVSQELRRHHFPSLIVELGEGEFGCPVHGHEEIELPLFGSDLGNIDVEIADGVFFERLFGRLVTFDFRQPAAVVALIAAMKR